MCRHNINMKNKYNNNKNTYDVVVLRRNDKNIQKKGIRDTADWENREENPSASKNCKKSKAETQLSEILLK